jgi:hypothetical protein
MIEPPPAHARDAAERYEGVLDYDDPECAGSVVVHQLLLNGDYILFSISAIADMQPWTASGRAQRGAAGEFSARKVVATFHGETAPPWDLAFHVEPLGDEAVVSLTLTERGRVWTLTGELERTGAPA